MFLDQSTLHQLNCELLIYYLIMNYPLKITSRWDGNLMSELIMVLARFDRHDAALATLQIICSHEASLTGEIRYVSKVFSCIVVIVCLQPSSIRNIKSQSCRGKELEIIVVFRQVLDLFRPICRIICKEQSEQFR